MDKIIITGGVALHGEIPISGAKNAALPLMCASLLTDQPLVLTNVPPLADIRTMAALLEQHGASVEVQDETYRLQSDNIGNLTAPYDMVRTMRASVLVLGPLLAKHGAAKVSLPGGCAIGTRPIDLHLRALEAMGALIELRDGYVHASVSGRLKAADITFEKVTVTGTENIVMAATLAHGTTTLRNAAREPEVQDLCVCLNAMGANISGIGTDTLVIEGVETLGGAEHRVVADRIEAGTYMAAVAATGGEVELLGAQASHMTAVIEKFSEAGVAIEETPRGLKVRSSSGRLKGIDIMTQPYPGFPTDMQAQMMAMLACAEGASLITETIFENRFMHVPELARMGANVTVHGASALVRGVESLTGAEVMATDLRASSCLVIAALAAEGQSVLHRVYHLDRGYAKLEEKLAACGAQIERVHGKPALNLVEDEAA